jgi:hypothetical protein
MKQNTNQTDARGNELNPVLYAVFKLCTDVEIINPLTGKTNDIKVNGIAGYIPVFDNLQEAEESAQNGKYQIVAIST